MWVRLVRYDIVSWARSITYSLHKHRLGHPRVRSPDIFFIGWCDNHLVIYLLKWTFPWGRFLTDDIGGIPRENFCLNSKLRALQLRVIIETEFVRALRRSCRDLTYWDFDVNLIFYSFLVVTMRVECNNWIFLYKVSKRALRIDSSVRHHRFGKSLERLNRLNCFASHCEI